MRLVLALVMVAMLVATADAQGRRLRSNTPAQTAEQKKKRLDAEKAHKSTLEKMPDKKYDPWAKVR